MPSLVRCVRAPVLGASAIARTIIHGVRSRSSRAASPVLLRRPSILFRLGVRMSVDSKRYPTYIPEMKAKKTRWVVQTLALLFVLLALAACSEAGADGGDDGDGDPTHEAGDDGGDGGAGDGDSDVSDALVTETFASDTGWTLEDSWEISDGALRFVQPMNGGSGLYVAESPTYSIPDDGTTYGIVFDTVSIPSIGNIKDWLNVYVNEELLLSDIGKSQGFGVTVTVISRVSLSAYAGEDITIKLEWKYAGSPVEQDDVVINGFEIREID